MNLKKKLFITKFCLTQVNLTSFCSLLFKSNFKYELLGDVDKESTKWFADIKSNLGRAISLRELRPGIVTWISRLNKYIRMYGLKFPKHDHVSLIKLLMSFVTTEGMLKS